MPLYFFHVMDREESLDNEGTEFADLDSVKAEASRTFAQMLCDRWQILLDTGRFCMVVKDDAGQTVLRLTCAAIYPM